MEKLLIGIGFFILGGFACFIYLVWYGIRKRNKILKHVKKEVGKELLDEKYLKKLKKEIDKKFMEDKLRLKMETEKKLNDNREKTFQRLKNED